MSDSQEILVARQFGPRAAAYLDSPVHAQGEDLRQLEQSLAGASWPAALDLGCGGGHVAFALAPLAGRVVAYDLSAEMLAAVAGTAAQRGLANIETRQGSVERLPFADESFDLLASRYSAHHWPDLAVALAEARRVLKPGGRAVFMDVVAPEGPAVLDTFLQAIELLRDPSHVRNYAVGEWCQALTVAGFTPRTVTRRRLRLEFASWLARIATPPLHGQAIRSLQAATAGTVRSHFAIEADGSFTLDTATIEAAG